LKVRLSTTAELLASSEIETLTISRFNALISGTLVQLRTTVGVADVNGNSSGRLNALVSLTLVFVTRRSGSGRSRRATREGGADLSSSDVGECDVRMRTILAYISGVSRGGSTTSTSNTRLGGIGTGGVGAIKPEHMDCSIVPKTHN